MIRSNKYLANNSGNEDISQNPKFLMWRGDAEICLWVMGLGGFMFYDIFLCIYQILNVYMVVFFLFQSRRWLRLTMHFYVPAFSLLKLIVGYLRMKKNRPTFFGCGPVWLKWPFQAKKRLKWPYLVSRELLVLRR